MAQLALEPRLLHLLACLRVQSGGLQGVGHPIQDRRAEVVALGAEQAARRLEQLLDRRALRRDRLAQLGRVPVSASTPACTSTSSSPAASNRSNALAWVRTSWLTAQAATDGLRRAATVLASSRLPSARSALARAPRCVTN